MPTEAVPDETGDVQTGSGAEVPAADLDTRLRALDDVAERPLAEHVDAYQRLHADLQTALAEIDTA